MEKTDMILTKLEDMDKRLDRMDERFDGIDKRLDRMDGRFDGIDKRLDSMDADIKGTKLIIENEIRPNIMRVAEGHLDLSRHLQKVIKSNNEYEMLTVKVSVLEAEMGELKRKIS